MHNPPRPKPPVRSKRRGIASIVQDERGVSREEAERVSRAIHRQTRRTR